MEKMINKYNEVVNALMENDSNGSFDEILNDLKIEDINNTYLDAFNELKITMEQIIKDYTNNNEVEEIPFYSNLLEDVKIIIDRYTDELKSIYIVYKIHCPHCGELIEVINNKKYDNYCYECDNKIKYDKFYFQIENISYIYDYDFNYNDIKISDIIDVIDFITTLQKDNCICDKNMRHIIGCNQEIQLLNDFLKYKLGL